MVTLGSALRCDYPPRHIWVVLSDPDRHDGHFLFVNLTTFGGSCVDNACILTHADYAILDRPSTVAYSRAKVGRREQLEPAIAKGSFIELDPVPQDTIDKMIAGAHSSRELSAEKKRLVP
jgi:hypothetical protein